MEITLNLSTLKNSNLSPNEAILLYLLYYKQFDEIAELFGKLEALNIRDALLDTEYILSDALTKFTETIISKKHVEKLFGIRSDQINFQEFYNCYPIRVGTRVLRASGPEAQVAIKHKKKYLAKVKTVEQHEKAIKAIIAFVSQQKRAGKLNFLPNMETVMNNSMWESWEVFIQDSGKEEQEWNNNLI